MLTIKKKRVSKKTKFSWRKHVNINDVEEFLEDQRLEERLGPPLASLTNEELFTLDTKPTEALLPPKKLRKLKLAQAPRCFALLKPHTNVPDPIKKRNRVRTPEERKNTLIKNKEADNRSKGIFKHRELQAIHDRKINQERLQAKPKLGEFDYNVWDAEEQLEEENSWFENYTVKHNLIGTGKSRKVIRNPVKHKTSIFPSVELPHPGMSYNPSFNDHQDLLKLVADKEITIIKEEKHLKRVTTNMFSKVSVAERDASWLTEMSEGLPQPTPQNCENVNDGDYKAINPPTKNVKKTLKQRRKQREQLQLALLRKGVKVEKKKVTDIHQLKLLKNQIQRNSAKTESLRGKRKEKQLQKKKKTKRLTLLKFEETDLEFNLGSDISGNLRNMKTEGNLLAERFNSLQKRNIIVPSLRNSRKKGKVKIYVKSGHKDDWKKTIAK